MRADSTMRPPLKISVVTAVRNARHTILATIQSVQAQSHPDVEHIIIDGASTDGTREIIRANAGRITKVVSEKDSGIYDAMNKGLRHATGDVIGFLNADDMFHDEEVLSDLARAFGAEPLDFAYGDVVFVRPGEESRVVRRSNARGFHAGRLAFGIAPPHPSFYARRSLYDEFGPMKTDYAVAADFEFIARVLQREGIKTRYIDRIFVTMRTGGASTSGLRAIWRNNREVLRACRENGIATSYPKIYAKYFAKVFELLPSVSRSEQADRNG